MQVWRQRNPEFVRMLNDIRTGNGKAAIQELLQQCSRPLPEQNGVKPTQLFSRNADVDTVNAKELRALQGEEVSSTTSNNCKLLALLLQVSLIKELGLGLLTA